MSKSEKKRVYNWNDLSNMIALVVQTSGQIVQEGCGRCKNKAGPFTECVVDSQVGIACAGCQYNKNHGRCSFNRQSKNAVVCKGLDDNLSSGGANSNRLPSLVEK